MHPFCSNPALKRNFANTNYPWSTFSAFPIRLLFNRHLIPKKRRFRCDRTNCTQLWVSIAITPLLGLALNYTPFGIRLSPILIVLSIFTISPALGAYVRRSIILEGDRFSVDFGAFLRERDK